jgi:phospholipase C
MTKGTVAHVVIFVQENHTTDNYFRSMRAWGANVATDWPTTPNPPQKDQPHDRAAYARWLRAQQQSSPTTATHSQFDTATVLPYYAYLAATGAFCENHCSGFGTNSTPNHLLIVGGQTPTLRNPPRSQPQSVWDMPSILGHAGDHGLTWKAYTGSSKYPVSFYKQLSGSPNIVHSDQIVADAKNLPQLSMVWHDSPYDEHPPADVTLGQGKIWQAVDAITAAGHWDDTVFLLTWDDWGGWDDHVVTPNVEHTPDTVQLAFGPRVPLLIFGGRVAQTVDSRWNSHVSIGKTTLDLLGLPALGVPRLDDAVSLADLVTAKAVTPPPPSYGSHVALPAPPSPTPAAAPGRAPTHHHVQPGRASDPPQWVDLAATQRPTRRPARHDRTEPSFAVQPPSSGNA